VTAGDLHHRHCKTIRKVAERICGRSVKLEGLYSSRLCKAKHLPRATENIDTVSRLFILAFWLVGRLRQLRKKSYGTGHAALRSLRWI